LKAETQKLQVKSGISWVLPYFECRFLHCLQDDALDFENSGI